MDSFAWARLSDPLGVWYTVDASGVLRSTAWVIALRKYCTYPSIYTFMMISGLTCLFSRDNLTRGFKILLAGFVISAFTYLMEGSGGQIRFGVLHCYGACRMLYDLLLKKKSNRVLLIIAGSALLLGYLLAYLKPEVATPFLYPFGVLQIGVTSRDYCPIFPGLGWFLLGVVCGRKFYWERKSLLSQWWQGKGTGWLQFMGRHSGLIYIGHVFVYTAVFILIGYIFNLL